MGSYNLQRTDRAPKGKTFYMRRAPHYYTSYPLQSLHLWFLSSWPLMHRRSFLDNFYGKGSTKESIWVNETSLVASTPTPAKWVIILRFPHVPNGLKVMFCENHNYLNRSTFFLPKFPMHRPPSTTSINTALPFSKWEYEIHLPSSTLESWIFQFHLYPRNLENRWTRLLESWNPWSYKWFPVFGFLGS